MADAVHSPLTDTICSVVERIPSGRVATYGQVARIAGRPRGARAVVWALRSQSRVRGLPWHRVVAAGGRIALPRGGGFEEQRALLADEGVSVSGAGRIDLSRFGWDGR